MFFQPPEKEKESVDTVKSSSSLKTARRKRKKRAQKFKTKKQALKKEKQRFANTMSSWAENFTKAATWQMKHQVAHWKSKAKALEYENNILRSMLRQYYVNGKVSATDLKTDEVMSVQSESEPENDMEHEVAEEEEEEENYPEEEQDVEEKIEISEEFIDFLKSNAEFRKMRLERERLRKLDEEKPMRLLEACPDGSSANKVDYHKLYGANWQRIAALEMSIQSQFISECDKDQPIVWPTLPLRM